MRNLMFLFYLSALMWSLSFGQSQADLDKIWPFQIMEEFGADQPFHPPYFHKRSLPGFPLDENLTKQPYWAEDNYPGRILEERPTIFQPSWAQIGNGFSDDVEIAWEKHYSSGLLPGDASAVAAVVDQEGNVYVAGNIWEPPFGYDYLIVKYNDSGDEKWTVRYNEGQSDRAVRLAIDPFGNLYITGTCRSLVTGYDYVTLKYNSEGIQQWKARYNGPANFNDWAVDMALDATGNVYITGSSQGSDRESDFATVKYNTEGIEQWTTRYDNPENSYDNPRALAVGGSGDIFVTGVSRNSISYFDYTTIKYNAAGVQEWVAHYNGPGNAGDLASHIAVDNDGQVYVAGYGIVSGNRPDFITVKYNTEGIQQWAAFYNGPGNYYDIPRALTTDPDGNVYVAGYSAGSDTYYDYTTIKYNSGGEEQWIARYNYLSNSDDRLNALALDETGNVYVTGGSEDVNTGYNCVTIKYNSTGDKQWAARYNGAESFNDSGIDLAVDESGNIFVVGNSEGSRGYDLVTLKYNPGGLQEWLEQISAPGSSVDALTDMVIDKQDNIYVTGTSSADDNREYDFATVKYNAEGTREWVARYNGTTDSSDRAETLAVDEAGNIYVTGYSWASDTLWNYILVKYNSDGIEQWGVNYSEARVPQYGRLFLMTDGFGNIYISTSIVDPVTGSDYVSFKYSPNGVQQWSVRYNYEDSHDLLNSMTVDSIGNLYLTGDSRRAGSGNDFATIKYNPDGVEQWMVRYNGSALWAGGQSLAVDASGNVYVTGYKYIQTIDYATIKYNSEGIQQWEASYNGPDNGDDRALNIAVDDLGNVYVVGKSQNPENRYDYAIVKYNFEGLEQWATRLQTTEISWYDLLSLALDENGDIYFTGLSEAPDTGYDYFTIKYNSEGTQKWSARYNGPANSDDWPVAMRLDKAGNIVVAGRSSSSDWSTYTTIKYRQIENVEPEPPGTFELLQNYPNPFNSSTTIRFGLTQGQQTRLVIYNLLGQVVRELYNEPLPDGWHEKIWDGTNRNGQLVASGIYFYILKTNDYTAARKMLLTR